MLHAPARSLSVIIAAAQLPTRLAKKGIFDD
jgi:hypothetical protein